MRALIAWGGGDEGGGGEGNISIKILGLPISPGGTHLIACLLAVLNKATVLGYVRLSRRSFALSSKNKGSISSRA